MINRPKLIIKGIEEHIQRCKQENIDDSPIYMEKRDHDMLANYMENKLPMFWECPREDDAPTIRNFMGVDILIIKE